MEQAADEIRRLKSCINDLVGVLGLRAIWSGSEPSQIVGTLLDVLVARLRLDFAYVRLQDPLGGAPVESLRLGPERNATVRPPEIGRLLETSLQDMPHAARLRVPNPLGEGDVSIVPVRLGLQDEMGLLVAGSARADFPLQTERLLLSVAANQAAIALHEGQRLNQRAMELIAANEELNREIAERRRAEEAFRFSEQRYALAMEASGEGHWDWNIATGDFYASPRMLELYGSARGTTFATRSEFLARFPFHPEDRPKWAEAAAAHFAGKTARFDLEIRMIPRGETRWIHLTGLVSRDASGKPLRWTGAVADITERKRAEEALRLSEMYLADAQRLSHTGSFGWDVASGNINWSDETYELMGLDRTIRPTLDHVLQRVHPEDLASFQDTLERATRAGEALDFEHRLLLDDGSVKHVHVRAHLVPRELGAVEYVGAVTDVTRRKRAEVLLAGEKQLFELMAKGKPLAEVLDSLCRLAEENVNGGQCGILLVDANGRLERGAAGRLPPGYIETILRRSVDPDASPCAMAASLKEQVLVADIAAETRRGEDDWCGAALAHGLRACWSTPILTATGKVLGTFALYFRQPSTPTPRHRLLIEQFTHLASIAIERAQAEEALRRSERQLRQAQRLEAMGTLAGGIAHDFNNILGAVLGYGEIALRNAPKGSRLRRDLESILAAGERGRALVDRILMFSRSGMGERTAVHVEEVVGETLGLLEPKLPEGIAVEAKLEAGRAAIEGEPTQVHQVLMNLATNAIHAMPSGGTLRVSLRAQSFDAERAATIGAIAAAEYIVLEVADSGVGIEAAILDRIFDPFFTTKEVGVGTGLGLSLVHGIVMEAGGAIDVASKKDSGSVFTVYLPRAGDASDDLEDSKAVLPQGGGQRVLVVDDEEPLVRLATETLDELGYAPVGFTSSVAALDAFRADPRGFDAVITDERMPGISGSEFIRQIRSARRSIPILLVSGYVGGMVAGRAYNEGADAVLKKPLSARDLATSLARVLRE